jgi:two-component system KDP operon response regulator KdpE
MKVLIVEDDLITVETISLVFRLRWAEAKLVSTTKGAEAIELVEAETPDVIILDLGLPDIDGMDVLKEIRSFSQVPIVILIARVESTSMLRGLESGADEYIIKPFDPMELLTRVKNVLHHTSVN